MIWPLHIKPVAWLGNSARVWLFITYGIIAWFALQRYISWQSVNVLLGIIALPMVITTQRNHTTNTRYAWIALFFAIACIWLPVKTLLYFAIVFACVFITETAIGKINLLPVLVAGFMSPIFQYASNVVSFPVRLWLSGMAASMMNMAGLKTGVAGNMILFNGSEFSVDPACMGLNMLVVCLLLQVMLIAVFQKQQGLQLKAWLVLILVMASLMLNIISNLFRIICLVWFNILPGSLMHDVAGIFCLLVYVVLPMIFITRWTVKKAGYVKIDVGSGAMARGKLAVIHIVLLGITCCSAIMVMKHDKATNDITAPVPAIPGFQTQRVDAEIIKLENKQSLVYVKHIPGFYNADHNPMICWKGSGYGFKQVEKKTIGNLSVYTALLQNGKDQLYTAWWYDNGSSQTSDQLKWRWDVLTGGNLYALVNVTTASEQQLRQYVNSLLQNSTLKPLLQ